MPRVKRGTIHNKRRKKLLKAVKGYKWGRKNLIRLATTARIKAGAHAFADRRKKKNNMRALWQIKISAFAKENDMSYSKLMGLFTKKKIELDRKILADLAENNKEILQGVLNEAKK
ncbi:MAG: 50S ribosomal protein L20 [Candidatus Pacebacteria bacterium]|nr:50S ribosomal protein L20 [Candidatus Paceibacterota bacterium]